MAAAGPVDPYRVKFVQAYAAAGVPVDYLSVQNEPQNRLPNAYPGTDLPVRQEVKVVEALGPLLRKASPRTRILAYDHNWTTHPGDIASTPPGESPETDYPYQILASPGFRLRGDPARTHMADTPEQALSVTAATSKPSTACSAYIRPEQ